MAIDGTYNITLQSPMGVQQGKLTLITDGNSLSGTSESMLGTTTFEGAPSTAMNFNGKRS